MADLGDPNSFLETARTVIHGIAGVAGAFGLLFEKIRALFKGGKRDGVAGEDVEPEMSAEAIVRQEKALNRREKAKVIRVLRTRFWVAAGLATLMLCISAFSLIAWQYVYPPPKPVLNIEIESAGPVNTGKDRWLKDGSNPLLSALFDELINAGGTDEKQYRVVTIRTKPVAGAGDRSRSLPAKLAVSFVANYYEYGPPYVFLHHQRGDTYEQLKTRSDTGGFEFDLPAGGPGDFLLIMGGLTNKISDKFPDRFDQIFIFRVVP